MGTHGASTCVSTCTWRVDAREEAMLVRRTTAERAHPDLGAGLDATALLVDKHAGAEEQAEEEEHGE